MTRPARSSIAGGSLRSLVFRILTAATDFLVVLVTARGLGASGRGLYALAALTTSVAVTFLGGTGTAITGEAAHKRSSLGKLHSVSAIVALGGGALVGAAIVGSAICFAARPWVFVLAAVAAPWLILNTIQVGLYVARGDLRRANWAYFTKSLVPLIGMAAALLAFPGNAFRVIAVWAGCQAVVPVVTLAAQWREARFERSGLREVLRRVVVRGSAISLGNGIALLNYRVDLIVVAVMTPLSSVGRYSVAIALAEAIMLLSRAAVTGAYSTIATSPLEASALTAARVVRHCLILLVTAAATLVAISAVLLEPVFGEQFAGVLLPLALLLPGVIALGGVTEVMLPFFLVRLEQSREYLLAATGAMLINLVAAVALVPSIGLAGAALATSVSYVAGATFLLTQFCRSTPAVRINALVPRAADVGDYIRLLRTISPIRDRS